MIGEYSIFSKNVMSFGLIAGLMQFFSLSVKDACFSAYCDVAVGKNFNMIDALFLQRSDFK